MTVGQSCGNLVEHNGTRVLRLRDVFFEFVAHYLLGDVEIC